MLLVLLILMIVILLVLSLKWRFEMQQYKKRLSHEGEGTDHLLIPSQKAELAIKTGGMVAWEYDVTNRLFYSENESITSMLQQKNRLIADDYCRTSHPDDLLLVKKYIKHIEEGIDESFSFNVRVMYDNENEWRHTFIVGIPIQKNQNGHVIKYAGFRRDDSALVKAKVKANELNELLKTMVARMPSAVFLKDADDDFRYIMVNDYFCNTFNLSREEVIGKTAADFLSVEDAEEIFRNDIDTIERGVAKTIDEQVVFNGVESIWQTTRDTFVTATGRKILLVIAIDMRERIRIQQELKDAKNNAELSNRLKSGFLANMSHEIRTPLNAIIGFSELIMETTSRSEQEQYRQIVAMNNELLLKLIDDILDLSKIEAGVVEFHRTHFDLVPYFNEISQSMKLKLKNPNVQFISVNPYESCMVTLDKSRLMQLIMNFVSNAIKYTSEGEIKMGYEKVEAGIRFYVVDTGIGIEEEEKIKIFDRFEKVDNFVQGSGLGLAICKAIAERTGDKIGFESEYQKGSTFWYIAHTEVEENNCYDDSDKIHSCQSLFRGKMQEITDKPIWVGERARVALIVQCEK